MLREEQAAELLKRCEVITGQRLEQVRGNLRKAESRSSAIWELLVLEEASRIGDVEYEPHQGASPDILLHLPEGRKIWIEIAFLYPRFWKQERLSNAVAHWITEEAIRRYISPFKVSCQFDGNRKNAAGPVRNLPGLHEKKQFLKDIQVNDFFKAIEQRPEQGFSSKHSKYSITFTYSPNREGPYLSTGGGLVQEAPKNVKEHAVYRVLKEKARQHQVQGPRLVCLGSDQSPALSGLVGPGNPTVRDAIFAAFNESSSLSGAIVLKIEDTTSALAGFNRRAKGEIFVNPRAKAPLFEQDLNQVCKFNFNRWKYFFRMEKFERTNNDAFRRVGGSLSIKLGGSGVELEIPSNLLIDSLAGKTNLIDEYALKEDDPIFKYLKAGWVVKSCSWKAGNIETGEAPKVVLGLEPPPEAVFWPNEKST